MTPAKTSHALDAGVSGRGREGVPRRIQLSRQKGWRLPAGAVVVARPTRWGNPWKVGENGVTTRAEAVRLYREWWARLPDVQPGQRLWLLNYHLRDLRGRDLACWCPLPTPGEPDHCHGAVLIELANRPVCDETTIPQTTDALTEPAHERA